MDNYVPASVTNATIQVLEGQVELSIENSRVKKHKLKFFNQFFFSNCLFIFSDRNRRDGLNNSLRFQYFVQSPSTSITICILDRIEFPRTRQ